MKFVTICQGGNVRSVALAYLLKYKCGHDAIACSWQKNSDETRLMLYQWADFICVLEEKFTQYVPEEFHNKIKVYEVGPDRWGNSLHPELLALLELMIEKNGVA
jgi:predicted protein tyrosine phosphatase